MSRIKIDLPEIFAFSTVFDLRITDLNYGAHVGNDKILSFVHEARVRWLRSLGYSELDLAGVGLIMADAALIFKQEIFYGDALLISLNPSDVGRVGFDLVYKIEKKTEAGMVIAAIVKTAMICYDYTLQKVVSVPDPVKIRLTS